MDFSSDVTPYRLLSRVKNFGEGIFYSFLTLFLFSPGYLNFCTNNVTITNFETLGRAQQKLHLKFSLILIPSSAKRMYNKNVGNSSRQLQFNS